MRKIKAFTLAELLIAMFIFAMLAVLLIPNVTNTAEKELFATQIKKVQNDVQQAMLVMLSRNRGTLQLMCVGGSPSKCFVDELAKTLEKNVVFTNTDLDSCTANGQEKKDARDQACMYKNRKPMYINKTQTNLKVNGTNGVTFNSIYLKNGAVVSVIFDPNCNNGTNSSGLDITDWHVPDVISPVDIQPANVCGYMEIDVNAGKVPNMVGKDIHYFWIVDQDGIVPFGTVDIFTCSDNQNKENDIERSLGCTGRLLRDGKIGYY